MTRQYRERKGDRITHAGATPEQVRCDYALGPLDDAVRRYDDLWGVDVLPTKVSPSTAEKYGRAMNRLNAAYDSDDPDAVTVAVEICIRGLAAMDKEARELGNRPDPLPVWLIDDEGKQIGIVRDTDQVARAEKLYPKAKLYTLRQAMLALRVYDNALVDAVVTAFPGAEITGARPRTEIEKQLEDEIPF